MSSHQTGAPWASLLLVMIITFLYVCSGLPLLFLLNMVCFPSSVFCLILLVLLLTLLLLILAPPLFCLKVQLSGSSSWRDLRGTSSKCGLRTCVPITVALPHAPYSSAVHVRASKNQGP